MPAEFEEKILQFKELIRSLSPYSPEKIRLELLERLLVKIEQPEEQVRYFWIQKLINEYGYDSNKIDINVPAGVGRSRSNVYADIVVFRDSLRTEPFIVGEVKRQDNNDNSDGEQSGSYARNIGAAFHFWSNKTLTKYWKTTLFPNKSIPIGNLPLWIGTKPILEKVKKKEFLPPFKDVKEFRQIISVLHNVIYKEGHDPAYAFDELTKLLFLKLYDERETPNFYEFMTIADEKAEEMLIRIQRLFDKAVNDPRYNDVFFTRYNRVVETHLDLLPQTIYQIVQQLQGYSLVNTTETIKGVDIKGEAFEQMVGGTFRGELGQYFTPREMVSFMVKMLDPSKTSRILDPSCGSGGFLIMCIKNVKERIIKENPNLNESEIKSQLKYFSEHNIFGLDINPRMARVAKMNMIMHGDGHSGIFNMNGLFIADYDPDGAKKEIREESFDLIFSNPPFAGYEKDPQILKQFELGKVGNKVRSVTKEVVFVERIIRLLRDGGKAAIVLPQGIFSDKGLKYARTYIKKHSKILALIALPHWAFRPTGTGVRGSLVFIQKMANVPKEYEVFIRRIDNIGYDSKGRSAQDDFDKIWKAYLNPSRKDWIKFSDLDNCFNYTDTGRIDPQFFIKESQNKLALFKNSPHPLLKLQEIAKFKREIFNPKKYPEKEFVYIEINHVHVRHGTIEKNYRLGKDVTQNTLIVHEGDLIISKRWPDRGAIAFISQEFEGALVVSEFSVLVIDTERIDKEFLYELLKSRPFLEMIDVYSTGEMSHRISENDLKHIEIPVPIKSIQRRIVRDITKLKTKSDILIEKSNGLREKADLKLLHEMGLPEVKQRKGQKEHIIYDRMNTK